MCDISAPFPEDGILPLGYFERIIAHDVLEHIPNLVGAMTNCLSLLAEGGMMDILVPYDLSRWAWRDPTHVRAFNEESWLYYTDWAWYLGWIEHRFVLDKLEFVVAEGVNPETPIAALTSCPRAIDAMKVILRKIKCNSSPAPIRN